MRLEPLDRRRCRPLITDSVRELKRTIGLLIIVGYGRCYDCTRIARIPLWSQSSRCYPCRRILGSLQRLPSTPRRDLAKRVMERILASPASAFLRSAAATPPMPVAQALLAARDADVAEP